MDHPQPWNMARLPSLPCPSPRWFNEPLDQTPPLPRWFSQSPRWSPIPIDFHGFPLRFVFLCSHRCSHIIIDFHGCSWICLFIGSGRARNAGEGRRWCTCFLCLKHEKERKEPGHQVCIGRESQHVVISREVLQKTSSRGVRIAPWRVEPHTFPCFRSPCTRWVAGELACMLAGVVGWVGAGVGVGVGLGFCCLVSTTM